MTKRNKCFTLFVTAWIGILTILFCFNKIEAADRRTYWNGYYFYITGFDCFGGKTIDWEYNGSAYLDNIKSAAQKWNAATKEVTYGKTSTIFRKDTWDTICDVTISDYNSDIDGNNAYIKINGYGFGNMKLNKNYMKDYNSSMRTAIVMHEFGHAIGLGDDSATNTIMYGYDPEVTELTWQDKQALAYVLRFVLAYK